MRGHSRVEVSEAIRVGQVLVERRSTAHYHRNTDHRLPMSDFHSDADHNDTLRPRPTPPTTRCRQLRVRLGTGSVFGLQNHFRFFGLPEFRPEYHRRLFGIRSVSVGDRSGHRKSRYDPSTLRCNGNECVVLIIRWSKVRVLPSPPLPIEIIALWH